MPLSQTGVVEWPDKEVTCLLCSLLAQLIFCWRKKITCIGPSEVILAYFVHRIMAYICTAHCCFILQDV